MRGILVQATGQGPQLEWTDVKDVTPGESEVLIQVYATAVNRADLAQARGLYPPPAGVSEILGLEAAGVILECGTKVSDWKVGDRVMALIAGGGYAERVVADEGSVLPIPEKWSFVEAAAFPEAFGTASINLVKEASLRPEESVLIHAGASGVGTAAIQLAKAMGAKVFVTVGSEEKAQFCRELGAEVAIIRRAPNGAAVDFVSPLMQATAGKGVDVVLDCVGGEYLSSNIELLADRGRLILIGVLGGGAAELNLVSLLAKQIMLKGSKLRTRSLSEKRELIAFMRQGILPLIERGEVKPIINKVLPIESAQDAHELLKKNSTIGKVVLEVRKR